MNSQPNRNPGEVTIDTFRNRERAFWQSRAMLRDPPQLTDLGQLARAIRSTWS